MKIALINENSQAAKNEMILHALEKVAAEKGFSVDNYGMYSAEDALDAYTFAQINDGNAIAIPFAKGFGWGGELNLEYIFEKLFAEESGQGYPRERAVPEQRNKKILDEVKKVTYNDLTTILKTLDRDLVKGALQGERFEELFFANCKCETLAECVREILNED